MLLQNTTTNNIRIMHRNIIVDFAGHWSRIIRQFRIVNLYEQTSVWIVPLEAKHIITQFVIII